MPDSKPEPKTSSIKATQAAKKVGTLIRSYYARNQELAQNGGHIAWCMVTVPWEPMHVMGVGAAYPEHYSTVCAAKQVSLPFLEKAEAEGFHVDLCSYARTVLGYGSRAREESQETPAGAPWGGLPRPTMMVGRGTCEAGHRWFLALQRYYNTPVFLYDQKALPADAEIEDEDLQKRYLRHEKEQHLEFIRFLEKVTGRKMDWDALSEAVARHQKSRRLWHEIHVLRRSVPCPMPSQDMAACIFPGYYMGHTQEAVDFYQELYHEVKERVDKGLGSIPDEKYRLLWGGIAQWHNLGFFNYLESLGAVFVAESNYYRDPFVDVDPSNPLEAIALRNWGLNMKRIQRARSFGNVGNARTGLILELVRDWKLDGVVLHLIQSCRPIAIGWLHTKNLLQERLNVPALCVESDMCDTRSYSDVQTKANVQAFIEVLASRKKKG